MKAASNDQSRAYYDDFATSYEDERGRGYHAMLDDLEVEVALPYAEGKRVLEVGCGTGLILERLAPIASSAIGVDLSPGMLEHARSRGLDVREASATELPFEDESFDLVCSFKVLAHVPEIGKAFEEIARVTAPGGTMLLELYNPYSLRYLAKWIAGPGKISDDRTEADVYTRWDSPLQFAKIVPAGVELVDVRGIRVFTPAAFMHRVPVVGDLLRRMERASVASPLRWFGGFVVLILRKG